MSANNNRQNTSASFNQTMINDLQNRINGNVNNGFVVCHEHSHLPIGDFHQNFSLGDFTSFMQMNEDNPVFKNRQVELTSCVVTSTGDINFVFYDNVNQNFYRFTNVVVIGRGEERFELLTGFNLVENTLFNDISMEELYDLMPSNPKWMDGARSGAIIPLPLFRMTNIKWIVPSDLNLINGVVNDLK